MACLWGFIRGSSCLFRIFPQRCTKNEIPQQKPNTKLCDRSHRAFALPGRRTEKASSREAVIQDCVFGKSILSSAPPAVCCQTMKHTGEPSNWSTIVGVNFHVFRPLLRMTASQSLWHIPMNTMQTPWIVLPLLID